MADNAAFLQQMEALSEAQRALESVTWPTDEPLADVIRKVDPVDLPVLEHYRLVVANEDAPMARPASLPSYDTPPPNYGASQAAGPVASSRRALRQSRTTAVIDLTDMISQRVAAASSETALPQVTDLSQIMALPSNPEASRPPAPNTTPRTSVSATPSLSPSSVTNSSFTAPPQVVEPSQPPQSIAILPQSSASRAASPCLLPSSWLVTAPLETPSGMAETGMGCSVREKTTSASYIFSGGTCCGPAGGGPRGRKKKNRH